MRYLLTGAAPSSKRTEYAGLRTVPAGPLKRINNLDAPGLAGKGFRKPLKPGPARAIGPSKVWTDFKTKTGGLFPYEDANSDILRGAGPLFIRQAAVNGHAGKKRKTFRIFFSKPVDTPGKFPRSAQAAGA